MADNIDIVKVVRDSVNGDVGPRELATNPGHKDNTLDWKLFHEGFPEFEYFTEDMIDLDTDAFKDDYVFAHRAEMFLQCSGAFVNELERHAAEKVKSLTAEIESEADPHRVNSLLHFLAYYTSVAAVVDKAHEKAKARFNVDLDLRLISMPGVHQLLCTPGQYVNPMKKRPAGRKIHFYQPWVVVEGNPPPAERRKVVEQATEQDLAELDAFGKSLEDDSETQEE